MSRERRDESFVWTDQADREHVSASTLKAPTSLGTVARRHLDIQCPAGHLVAVLARDKRPALYVEGAETQARPGSTDIGAPVVKYLVDGGQLFGALAGRGWAEPLGEPRPGADLWCRRCARSVTVPAAVLVQAATHRGGRPGRFRASPDVC